MINIEKGNVSLEGRVGMVMAELSVLVHCLYYEGNIPKDRILVAVMDGFKTTEEMEEEVLLFPLVEQCVDSFMKSLRKVEEQNGTDN